MKRRRAPLEEAPINLTPLIDVVFVILIMFIVVAPLLEMDHVELAEGPPLSNPAQTQKIPLTIHVFADGTLALNKQRVTLDELQKRLIQAKRAYPEAAPQLYHDREATFGTYQAVKNAVELAGFTDMDVLLKPS